MTGRADKRKLVLKSIENTERDRCVDLFERADGTFGFDEFRRDPEDRGAWTQVQFFGGAVYVSEPSAMATAVENVGWLKSVLRP